MSEWNSCNRRLPKDTKDVLVYDGYNMFVAWYVDNEWYSWSNRIDRYRPILAWMPLPHEPFFDEDGNDLWEILREKVDSVTKQKNSDRR